jgi:hypothetical protein
LTNRGLAKLKHPHQFHIWSEHALLTAQHSNRWIPRTPSRSASKVCTATNGGDVAASSPGPTFLQMSRGAG